MVTHQKQVLENIFALLVFLQNKGLNQIMVVARGLANMIQCKNEKCKKLFEPETMANEPDPSPDFEYCSNTCYQIGMKQEKYAKDKRKSLHVKPDTYELYLKAKTKLSNKFNLATIGETDNDDRVLFSIFANFLLEDV